MAGNKHTSPNRTDIMVMLSDLQSQLIPLLTLIILSRPKLILTDTICKQGFTTICQALNPQGHHGIYDEMRLDHPRSNSPYGRSSGSSHVSSHGSSHVAPPRSYSPPPVTPTSPEEPTIKKKRKRADAAQLKVLNETYSRTAFPSTEERIALAKMLDMSRTQRADLVSAAPACFFFSAPLTTPRRFQNKRQSMRQTNRQSSSVASAHHQYALPSQVDPMSEDLVPPPAGGLRRGRRAARGPALPHGPTGRRACARGALAPFALAPTARTLPCVIVAPSPARGS